MSDEPQGTSFTHPLTQALHPDPNRFGERATVVGYPGPSPRDGRVRVYLDTTFTSYYELDEQSVLHTARARAGDENSPVVVAIASDTPVQVVRVQSGQTEARFLEGSISGQYLPDAASAGQQPAAVANGCTVVTNTAVCTVTGLAFCGGNAAPQAAAVANGCPIVTGTVVCTITNVLICAANR